MFIIISQNLSDYSAHLGEKSIYHIYPLLDSDDQIISAALTLLYIQKIFASLLLEDFL